MSHVAETTDGEQPPGDGKPKRAPSPKDPKEEPGEGSAPEADTKRKPPTAADEYVESERYSVTSVFVDNRSYGVYAEGSITAKNIAGRDNNVTSGASDDTREEARRVSVVAIASRDRDRLRRVSISAGPRSKAAEILKRERLVILHGPDGVGKAAAGIGLLGFDHDILSIDQALTIRALTDFRRCFPYGKNRRYLIEGMPPATAAQLSGFAVRAAAQDLEAKDSYLVITVDGRIALSPELTGYVVAWVDRPDTMLTLRSHLDYYRGDKGPVPVDDAYDLARLCEGLAQSPLRRINAAARTVVEGLWNSVPFNSVLSELGFDAPTRVAQWFSQERPPEELGFLLAVAVLGGCSYSTVARHASRLEKLIAAASDQRVADPLRSRSKRLHDAMAVLKPGFVHTEYGQSPTDTVEMESRWLVQAVLRRVWNEYDLLAEVLLRWLRDTGEDPDAGVRLRAAAAAGWLSQFDFAVLRRELFLPWALGTSNGSWSAADALGIAASEESTAPLALALLNMWSRQDSNYDLWWTAAVAYGGETGVSRTGVAMDHLLIIAGRDDTRAQSLVVNSLLRLVGSGGRFVPEVGTLVLAHLGDWREHGLRAGLTAWAAYAEILRRAADADWPSQRNYWRLLTATENLDTSAALLGAALNERSLRDGALESVEALTRMSGLDKDILRTLATLLIRVAAGGTNDKDRLLYYLDRWARGRHPVPAARDISKQLKEVTVS